MVECTHHEEADEVEEGVSLVQLARRREIHGRRRVDRLEERAAGVDRDEQQDPNDVPAGTARSVVRSAEESAAQAMIQRSNLI